MIAWTDLSKGLRAALVQTFHDKVDGVGPATCMLVRTASRFLFGRMRTLCLCGLI